MVAQDMSLHLVSSNCPVHYANESADAQPTANRTERLTVTKARVMSQVVTSFYSRYDMQSWKNVISIGDAFYEHAAVHDVIRNRPEYSSQKKMPNEENQVAQKTECGRDGSAAQTGSKLVSFDCAKRH